MASTYSNLKIQLMATGENSGTWGNVTNVNLGTALEEAIVGSADVTFSSADVTLSLTDSNASQTARNLRLNLTGTVSAAQNLVVPAIEKVYLVNNTLSYAITVKNSTGTGIAVPAGKTMWVYNNGTNVVDAVTHLTSLTLGTVLPVASGGTGTNTSTGSGNVVLSTSPTLVTPVLGTPASGTLTNCTGLPLSTGISGLGTNVATFLATPSSANLAAAVTGETGSGALVFATSPTLVTPALGTPTSGILSNCTGLPLTTGISGTLAIANGGTGTTSTTYCNLQANVTGTLPVGSGGTGTVSSTGTGSVVLSASPTFTGSPAAPTAANGTITTQIATTAFVSAAVTNATSALGTMSTQNANAVAITGGTLSGVSISGITDLAVADGGTGASTFTANSVVLGNGTSSLAANMVAPGTSGNVLTSNGTTWASSALSSLSTFANLLEANGYQKLPGGLIIQWCQSAEISSETTTSVTWPITFPNAILRTIVGTAFVSGNADLIMQLYSQSTTGCVVMSNSLGAGGSVRAYILAIGY